ncbi:MAG: F0F1 ATP synthase subunit delta [Bacteroidaceae bacterium]|nr:F0F1 ATP synthase subunit delta [Bacteroidaceae bacterium]
MTNGSIAKRYAKALFEEAKDQFVDQQVYEHLGVLYASMKSEPDLQMALINPRVTPEKKYTLLLLASGLDPEATTLYTRFLHLLIENRRENQLRLIIYVYRDLYREHHGIDRVVFETATPVDDKTVERLVQRIHSHTHRTVECERKVNPDLIGGFRLRIGDRRYDYSYKHQLEKIRESLGATFPRT